MEEKRSITGLIFIVVALVVFPSLYVGAYAGTVRRGKSYSVVDGVFYLRPDYIIYGRQYDRGVIQQCFHPVYCIDRRIRHDYWTDEEIDRLSE